MVPWSFEEIEINGGFLAGVRLRLPVGLTCIIGPRGSGKSTLAEALRYAILGAPTNSKARQELIQVNLGPSSLVTVNTRARIGPVYSIRRSFKQAPVLQTDDGRPVEGVDLDRGTFLPLDAFTALEIEAIADESLGSKRRALLDDLRAEDLRQIHVELSERRRALEANADKLRLANSRLSDLKERLEEAGDVRARLAATPAPEIDPKAAGHSHAVKQQQRNQKEATVLGDLATVVQALPNKVETLQNEFRSLPDQVRFEVGSENGATFTALTEQLRRVIAASERQWKALSDTAGQLKSAVIETQVAVRSAHVNQAATHAEISKQNETANAQVLAHARLEEEVQKLDQTGKDILAVRAEVERLETERRRLKGDFILAQEAISDLREQVAGSLAEESGPNVRVAVARNADNLGYQQILTEGLRGARVRNHDEILAKLMAVRPEDLAQMIHHQDATSFEQHMGFGAERSRKILEAFQETLDPLSLEVISIDDSVRIELNVSTGANPFFKDAAELSRGQKCTALLPLLLARRDCPLIADQPEDNLDNHFIYETVVSAIRRMRNRRQMILVTHNANIPVLGEADLVVVMNSDGRVGYVEKTGSVDDCQHEIIDLLEGGREAFDRRSARYGHR
jgi:energy-coupling factor transporter ATP-binding protein EcfA2